MTVSYYETGVVCAPPRARRLAPECNQGVTVLHVLYREEKQHADVSQAHFNTKVLPNNRINMLYVKKQKLNLRTT